MFQVSWGCSWGCFMILNRFNFKVSISPFSKMLLFYYYTKKNVIIYEVDISQTKCLDLKYHLETNLSFPNLRENGSFWSIDT